MHSICNSTPRVRTALCSADSRITKLRPPRLSRVTMISTASINMPRRGRVPAARRDLHPEPALLPGPGRK